MPMFVSPASMYFMILLATPTWHSDFCVCISSKRNVDANTGSFHCVCFDVLCSCHKGAQFTIKIACFFVFSNGCRRSPPKAPQFKKTRNTIQNCWATKGHITSQGLANWPELSLFWERKPPSSKLRNWAFGKRQPYSKPHSDSPWLQAPVGSQEVRKMVTAVPQRGTQWDKRSWGKGGRVPVNGRPVY